jgi:hypothetical protein
VLYYLIENKNGFEGLVFQGSRDEAEAEKSRREAGGGTGTELEAWLRTRYYVVPENEWTHEIGAMH